MARQIIGVGTTANDGTGDTPRSTGVKINAMTAELYNGTAYPTTPPIAGGMWANPMTGELKKAPDTRPILVWTAGESNTGGYVPINKQFAYSTFIAGENIIVGSAAPATQTVSFFSTRNSQVHNLSFYGTGTITYSGAASGTLVGTGVGNRVNVNITPSGSPDSYGRTFLTLTITGTVTNASLTQGSSPITWAENVTANTIQWAEDWETAPRSDLRIFNRAAVAFESLDLGTNNNMLHGGLHPGVCGWERVLANHARIGSFGSRPVYWCQTGAGGSVVATWQPGANGGTLEDAILRFNLAEALVGNATHILLVQIGINDAESGTTKANYKAGLVTMLNSLKAEAVNPIVVLPKIPATGGAYNALYDQYNTAIDEIVATDTATYKTLAATNLQIYGSHWTYTGMNEYGHRIYDTIKTALSISTTRPITWSANGDGPFLRFIGAAPKYAYSTTPLSAVKGFSVIEERRVEAGNTIIAVSANTTPVAWFGASDPYLIGWYYSGGNINILQKNDTTNMASYTLTLPAWVRAISRGPDILVQTSTDGGANWTTIHTRSNILAGQTDVYVKAVTISADVKTWVWTGDGL